MNTILLTGNIAPVGANETKIQVRLKQYISNIQNIIQFSNIDKIIFCENSGYQWDSNTLCGEAKNYNKEFEYLSFVGNQEKTQKFGRGYGDQEIIEYCVNHSKLLENEDSFYKLTGRYTLLNTNRILSSSSNKKNVFMRMGPADRRISTAFFKIGKEFFKKYLVGIGEKVDDSKGEEYQLEGIYTKIISEQTSEVSSFSILPLFSGITGSGYQLQDTPLRRIIKKTLFLLGFYRI